MHHLWIPLSDVVLFYYFSAYFGCYFVKLFEYVSCEEMGLASFLEYKAEPETKEVKSKQPVFASGGLNVCDAMESSMRACLGAK